MPIEDYLVAWSETRSAPVRVGRLLIPAQRVGESVDQQAGENLSDFNF